jgi:hypothetical protein
MGEWWSFSYSVEVENREEAEALSEQLDHIICDGDDVDGPAHQCRRTNWVGTLRPDPDPELELNDNDGVGRALDRRR